MIAAFSGHRTGEKLGGYQTNPLHIAIKKAIYDKLLELKPEAVIVGGALGVDTWAAEICLELGLQYTLAVPFVGQERVWPQKSRDHYDYLKSKASNIVIVCDGGYGAWKLQKRNQWMVDNCDTLIAIWDGTDGGTGNCVAYANSINRKIIRINPSEMK